MSMHPADSSHSNSDKLTPEEKFAIVAHRCREIGNVISVAVGTHITPKDPELGSFELMPDVLIARLAKVLLDEHLTIADKIGKMEVGNGTILIGFYGDDKHTAADWAESFIVHLEEVSVPGSVIFFQCNCDAQTAQS